MSRATITIDLTVGTTSQSVGVEVDYTHERAMRATEIDPPEPERAEPYAVWLTGVPSGPALSVNIIGLLDADMQRAIELAILEQING
jgi:hypothetical protein